MRRSGLHALQVAAGARGVAVLPGVQQHPAARGLPGRASGSRKPPTIHCSTAATGLCTAHAAHINPQRRRPCCRSPGRRPRKHAAGALCAGHTSVPHPTHPHQAPTKCMMAAGMKAASSSRGCPPVRTPQRSAGCRQSAPRRQWPCNRQDNVAGALFWRQQGAGPSGQIELRPSSSSAPPPADLALLAGSALQRKVVAKVHLAEDLRIAAGMRGKRKKRECGAAIMQGRRSAQSALSDAPG